MDTMTQPRHTKYSFHTSCVWGFDVDKNVMHSYRLLLMHHNKYSVFTIFMNLIGRG